MTCIRLRFFIMLIFRIHVIFWFILHRSAKAASKLVQKLGRDKRSTKYVQFAVFIPLLLPIYIFVDLFFFRNIDHVK